jgi:hypothetical protein
MSERVARGMAMSLTLLASLGWTSAQEVAALHLAGTRYVALDELARALGWSTSDGGSSLTVRSGSGLLIVFEASPEVWWQPQGGEGGEVSFLAPVLRRQEGWFVPDELLGLLDLAVDGEAILVGSRRLPLAYPPLLEPAGVLAEGLELGRGVRGLTLFAAGSAGDETMSLLLVDAALLGLAFPEQQAEVDAFIASLERGRPLYFVLTALAPSPWETSLHISQHGRAAGLRYPLEISVLEGEAGWVGPEAPVSGVILLPDWVNLREPLVVRWGEREARFQFRR